MERNYRYAPSAGSRSAGSRLRLGALVASVLFSAAAIVVPPASAEASVLDVRDYGAVGDGVTDDTAAIQRANDAVAAQGGGVVHFPPGVYIAKDVRHDSFVEFTGSDGAVLKHPDGVSSDPIIEGRVYRTNGTVQAGSTRLDVVTSRRFVPGAVVGIRAAGGPSAVQTTQLAADVSAEATELLVAQPKGWRLNGVNFLIVEDEIVSYQGMSGFLFTNVKRGLLGTKAVDHAAGAPVSLAQGLYAQVISVGEGTVELDRPAVKSILGAAVFIGSVDMAVRNLTLDGSRPVGGSSPTAPVVLHYGFARRVTVENSTIRNGAHGAVSLDQGTSDAVVANNVLVDNGDPSEGMGSAVWLYRGARRNVVRDNGIGGSSTLGVMADDRTEIASEWDASSDDNVISGNVIDFPGVPKTAAVFVAGSNRNEVAGNELRSTERGVSITRSTQGLNPGDSEGNLVRDNTLTGHGWALYVTGSYNRFERNAIDSSVRDVFDSGTGNTYVWPEPTPDPTPEPTLDPTPEPTLEPTLEPTAEPTVAPEPTQDPAPTASPANGRRKQPVGGPKVTTLETSTDGDGPASVRRTSGP